MNGVWAVIPTYSRAEMALRAVESLLAQVEPLDGVVLVDDCGPAGIAAAARARFGERVRALRLENNAGPAGSFAAGIRAALELGAARVWLLDDDACAMPDALQRLLASPHSADPATAALCSVKQSPDGQWQPWEKRAGAARRPARLNRAGFHPRTMSCLPLSEYQRDEFEADAVPFAGLLVPAPVLARAGLPDARYFSWFADYEWSLRLRRCGRIFGVPPSRLIHEDELSRGLHRVVGRARPNLALFERQCIGLRNSTYYFLRHGRPATTALEAGWRFCRMAGGIVLFDSQKWLRLSHLARAFLDGFRGRLGPFPLRVGRARVHRARP